MTVTQTAVSTQVVTAPAVTTTVVATSTVTVTASPTASAEPSATMPAASPSATQAPASPWVYVPVEPYEVDGTFTINGRLWRTTCENYSRTVRCRTEIWGTKVDYVADKYVQVQGWLSNNLSYLPYMTRSEWGSNPLARTGAWTSTTGKGASRSYVEATVIVAGKDAQGATVYTKVTKFVLNNMVRFKPVNGVA